jgi:hypothetical protein
MNIITKNSSTIKSVALAALAILAMALLGASAALAQSSGNFAASIQTAQCTMNTDPTSLTPGSLSGGGTLLDTYIQTPSSKFTTLVITPALVTGLFNNTQVTTAMPSSANSAAVVVKVTLDGTPVLPETSTNTSIIYDQRFQQLSAPLFSQLMECTMNNNCSIDLVESTLSAHSFNFIRTNVGGGVHPLKVTWEFVCTDNTGATMPCANTFMPNTAGACAGPGTIMVQQVKAFTQSGGIQVQ